MMGLPWDFAIEDKDSMAIVDDNDPWHFSCKFPQNGSSEMSMCVSTAQARTKR